MSGLLWPCFAVSGAAALGLELLWMRSAGLVLGATAPTAATVLAGYFAGLGVGAALARGAPRRPIARYAILELGAAAGALWSVAVFRALSVDGAQEALGTAGLSARVAAVALALLPATLCLGATLPVLGHALAASSVGKRGGLLYALNTLGGALGIAAMGFGLPGRIGVTISLGVMTAGPLVTFGFLVVPPLTARLLTRRMLSFSLVAAAIGGAAAFGGFYCAYRMDLPLGPAEVALASLMLIVVGTASMIRQGAARLRAP